MQEKITYELVYVYQQTLKIYFVLKKMEVVHLHTNLSVFHSINPL